MLLRARWVLPIVAEPIEDGAVLVEGGAIAAVGPISTLRAAHPAAPLRDLGRAILLPGLVNAHSHLDYTALRGLLDELPFVPWIRELTRISRLAMSEVDLLTSARWGAKRR